MNPLEPRFPHRAGAESDPASGKPANGNGNGNASAALARVHSRSPLVPARSTPSARDLTLEDVVRLLRTGLKIIRSRWLYGLAAATVVVFALGYFVMRLRPEETAVTTMLAQSPLDQVLRPKGDVRGVAQDQENVLRNHLSVMESRGFTVRAAKDFSDQEMARIMTPYLEPGEAPTRAGLEQLLARKLNAKRERGREFFTLQFDHVDGDVAVLVADRVTAVYLKLVQEEMKQANSAAASLLRKQAQQIQEDISRLEKQRRDYRKENNLISLESNQGILADRLRQIDQKRSEARMARVQLEAQLVTAAADIEAGPAPYHNPLLASFANTQNLRVDHDRLLAEREVLAARYGPNHPKMRDLEASIQGVQENIARNFQLAHQDLRSRYEAARGLEDQLEKEFVSAFGTAIEIERLADPYLVLGSEIEAKRATLSDLLRRVNTAGVVSQLPTDVMRVVDPAYLAQAQISKPMLYWALTFVLACGAFVLVPLTLHLFDERIKSATDVEEELGKELLGGIPRLSHARPNDRPHVVRDNGEPDDVEAFMALVAQLELASHHPTPKAVLVTSTISGEGKSTIVSNLAAGFTRLGKRTIIVDCDFRRPCQHLLHRVPNDRGLLAWEHAGRPTSDLFAPDSPLGVRPLADGTHLLAAGGVDPQPTRFLISPEVSALFAALRERFDVLVIDTPPAGLFQDAMVLARHAQETLFIAREGRASTAQVRRTLSDLDKTAAPVLGLVLNEFSFLSLNPRLAYGSAYRSYNYKPASRSRGAAARPPTVGV